MRELYGVMKNVNEQYVSSNGLTMKWIFEIATKCSLNYPHWATDYPSNLGVH